MSSETRHVRLKPYDPRAGYVLKAYAVNVGRKLPARFDAGKWYEVPKVMADYLSTVRERENKPHSPLAFDVCKDAKDAKALLRREELERQRGKKPEDAVDMATALTTGDLAPPKPAALAGKPEIDLTDPDLDADVEEDEDPEPEPPRRKRKPKAKPKASKKAKPKAKAKKATAKRKR